MEEWRELARSVPGTLLLVVDGTTTRRLLASFDRTHGRLQRVVNLAVCLRSGDTDLGRPSAEPCPSVNVEETRRELDRLTALHGAAGRVFIICAMFLGHRADPLWESWEVHRAAALDHAAEAQHLLRSVATHARAARAADRMADSFDRPSPAWDAWVAASLSHARRTIWVEMRALAAVCRMCDAVALEFFDAWMILNR
ncbi:hypothetical protein PVAP13_5NG091467 [Panicum virgatum]|uniref:Uncharacterized protein n=1 Tax=Panicum virgatum TaxID=38727 RepID=A0A8T0RPW4_PANVG|nr:hypothetical protein PVAP13_5NG091467 [Panicum virgatum]